MAPIGPRAPKWRAPWRHDVVYQSSGGPGLLSGHSTALNHRPELGPPVSRRAISTAQLNRPDSLERLPHHRPLAEEGLHESAGCAASCSAPQAEGPGVALVPPGWETELMLWSMPGQPGTSLEDLMPISLGLEGDVWRILPPTPLDLAGQVSLCRSDQAPPAAHPKPASRPDGRSSRSRVCETGRIQRPLTPATAGIRCYLVSLMHGTICSCPADPVGFAATSVPILYLSGRQKKGQGGVSPLPKKKTFKKRFFFFFFF